jgi:hypothetical protein
MVKDVARRLRPSRGFAHILHLSLIAVIPLVVFVFVRLEIYSLALAVILLSKWRMFAIAPRHWLLHIRSNAVDIIVSLSILTFMIVADTMVAQLLWVALYELWVLYIKPGTRSLLVSLQALIGQFAGLAALFLYFEEVPLGIYILFVAAITYFCARHFFGSFEEEYATTYSWVWAFFSGCLTWVLGHWLLFYGPIAQPALMLTVVGYGLAALYYLAETDKLSILVRRQIVFVMLATIIVMIVFSDWGDKAL